MPAMAICVDAFFHNGGERDHPVLLQNVWPKMCLTIAIVFICSRHHHCDIGYDSVHH